jgi:hypothetical protein
MNLIVVERADCPTFDIDSQFCMQQLIWNPCRLGVLVYALAGSLLQQWIVGSLQVAIVIIQGGLTYLQTVLMPVIANGKYVDKA